MREIEFRGQHIATGEWKYGYYFVVETTDYQDEKGNIQNKLHYIYCNNKQHRVRPETIGQFVGLEDKNGKKIFEGDIVWHIDQKYGEMTYKVFFRNGIFCLRGLSGYDKGDVFSIEFLLENNVVIGNIHNNPELIKAGEK